MTESATRAAYDSVAVLYADTFRDVMDDLPLDRAMVAAFAELVRGDLPVADLGCGPGYLTAHLASLGLSAFGVDLSPGMLAQAREEHPDLRFDEGTMTSLDLADESLGGILAWYSIIHKAPDELPPILAEFHRVLAPGGHVLVGFQTCEKDTPEPFDHKVALAYRWPPGGLSAVFRRAGLIETARLVRQPTSIHERTPAGILLLRKP
ncbi:class I SAM-dependent methyltransferase [Actinomadura spongiicola]|uniref:Class I SAM-dependent methyltransferase n=1 Tax=Actinomadura spongiicola TaxID=2303421 RepID=A0A372GCP5_9ACTN|nr:class I SAM-dependent methyltransferase [Actinomadura spongiicola]RFS83174.1 class I SAM-dependent methyltransferase [Actinomadura spongiicola]